MDASALLADARKAPTAVVKTSADALKAALQGKWRKSSRSYDIGACAEVLSVRGGTLLRDTQYRNENDTVLDFGQDSWVAATAALK